MLTSEYYDRKSRFLAKRWANLEERRAKNPDLVGFTVPPVTLIPSSKLGQEA